MPVAILETLKTAQSVFLQKLSSLNIPWVVGDTPAESRANRNFGNTYKSMRDFPKAIWCNEKSLYIVREVGDLSNTEGLQFQKCYSA